MSGGVPAGWVLVPVEPTAGMLDAGVLDVRSDVSYHDVEGVWSAMLSAVPTPTPPPSRDADVERVAGAMWNASPYYDGTPWDDVSWRRYNGTCDTRELYLALARAALQALGERG